MIELAIAWVIIGTITFLGILMQYMEGRRGRFGSPLSWQDVWFIPVGLALLIFGWPIAYWKRRGRRN